MAIVGLTALEAPPSNPKCRTGTRKGSDQVPAHSEILKSYGLPDQETFEIRTERPDFEGLEGLWMVVVSTRSAGARVMFHEDAKRFADAVRIVDPTLADQLDEGVERAKRYARNKD